MRRVISLAGLVVASACSLSSTEPIGIDINGAPPNFGSVGQNPAASGSKYSIGLTTHGAHGGSNAFILTGFDPKSVGFSGIGQALKANNYRGKRVRFSAWVKQRDITGPDVGLWMRVDGPGATLAFDNMSTRTLAGTTDWHQVEIILDIAPEAIGIAFGVIMQGSGSLEVDDMKWEIIPPTGPTTDQYLAPNPTTFNAELAYASNTRLAPENLDFENR
jgi:hypothetical protein